MDLDGLTAGHGLGASLTYTLFTTEGHLVSNGERLPGREKRERFSTSLPRDPVVIGDLTTHVLTALW